MYFYIITMISLFLCGYWSLVLHIILYITITHVVAFAFNDPCHPVQLAIACRCGVRVATNNERVVKEKIKRHNNIYFFDFIYLASCECPVITR